MDLFTQIDGMIVIGVFIFHFDKLFIDSKFFGFFGFITFLKFKSVKQQ
jgi:hypothetical protein